MPCCASSFARCSLRVAGESDAARARATTNVAPERHAVAASVSHRMRRTTAMLIATMSRLTVSASRTVTRVSSTARAAATTTSCRCASNIQATWLCARQDVSAMPTARAAAVSGSSQKTSKVGRRVPQARATATAIAPWVAAKATCAAAGRSAAAHAPTARAALAET
jgi:hypothetical protein